MPLLALQFFSHHFNFLLLRELAVKKSFINIASCLPVVLVINSDLEVFVKVVPEMVCVELCKGVLASERGELVSTSTTVEGIVRRQRHGSVLRAEV